MIDTINNTSDYLQNLSVAELRNWCQETTPITMIWADDDLSSEVNDEIEERSKEQTNEYIQSLSISEIKALFANGTPVQKNWSDSDNDDDLLNNADYFEKSAITGLLIETIILIETNTHEAVLGDILTYCQKLDIDLQAFMADSTIGK